MAKVGPMFAQVRYSLPMMFTRAVVWLLSSAFRQKERKAARVSLRDRGSAARVFTRSSHTAPGIHLPERGP